ncbi:MAG: GNAT family N-acetyltransferase [Planctomycetes bacterium]|nr:GNAT family N-acetyltransferase [Planctomycetota bacterium]
MSELDHPDSTWNRAVRADDHGDPFCARTEWQLSFHESFAPGRKLHVRSVGDSVIAFAERPHGEVTVLEPIDCNWLFGSPLLGPEAVPMLRELTAELPDHPVLISGLLPDGARLAELVREFARDHELLRVATEVACCASLDGGFDGYLSRRSAKLRRGVRNAARRAERQGVTFERHAPTTHRQSDAVYQRILAVEASSWKGIGRCGMAEGASRTFYRVMLRRLSVSGNGRVVFARHGDRDIGFIFGGIGSDVYRGQQFSFAEDWRRSSIGNLLQLEQVRWLCEDGVGRYDMGPMMDYKQHWTEQRVRFDAIALRPA